MSGDLQNDVAKRLKRVRISLKTNQKRIAEKFKIAQATYNRYENGEHPPSSVFLYQFCKVLNVNMDWLFTGEGQMFSSDPEKDAVDSLELIRLKKDYDKLKEENAELKKDLVARMAEIIDLQKIALNSKNS